MTAHQFKLYSKLAGAAAAVLAVLLFVLANRNPVEVNVLWLAKFRLPAYALMVLCALLGIGLYLIIKSIRQFLRQYRQMKHENRVRRELLGKEKEKNR